jgi:vitamin B12 transporter
MKTLVTGLVVLALPLIPFSQTDMDSTRILPEVEITEKRLSGLPFSSSARNIQVITRAEIDQMPAQTLAEVITYTSGVDLRQRGPWGAQADITMLGSTFEQVLVLINGIPMRDPQTGHHQMNLPVDLSQVDRIEVLKGSAARIYGANALAGAINIITRTPGEDKVFLQTYAGNDWNESFGMTGNRVGFGLRPENGRSSHQVDYSMIRSEGYRYNSANDQHRINLMSQVKTKGGEWNLIAGAVDNEFGAHSFYAHPFDRDAHERVRGAFGGLSYITRAGEWTIRPLVYYRYNHDDYIFIRKRPEVYRNNHYTTAAGAEVHASAPNRFGAFGVGYEARGEVIRSNNLGSHERYYHSVYVEQRMMWSSGVNLTAGANVQVTNDYGLRVNPGLEFSAPVLGQYRVFANAGTGNRLPTYTDLYYSDRANTGNPDLQPELALNGEAGIRKTEGNFRGQVSGFTRLTDDFIDFVRSADTLKWQPQNFSQVRINGLEAQLTYSFPKTEALVRPEWVQIQYTGLTGEIERGGMQNKYALDHLAHQIIGRLVLRTSERMTHTFSVRYLERFNGQEYAVADYRGRISWGKFAAFGDITNLLDREFVESGFIPMPGRWFRLGLEWRL